MRRNLAHASVRSQSQPSSWLHPPVSYAGCQRPAADHSPDQQPLKRATLSPTPSCLTSTFKTHPKIHTTLVRAYPF
eukprot:826585-Rhodomonas_salina.1